MTQKQIQCRVMNTQKSPNLTNVFMTKIQVPENGLPTSKSHNWHFQHHSQKVFWAKPIIKKKTDRSYRKYVWSLQKVCYSTKTYSDKILDLEKPFIEFNTEQSINGKTKKQKTRLFFLTKSKITQKMPHRNGNFKILF